MSRYWVALLLVTIVLAGCAVEQEYSRTPRTAVEQLLLTQAIERAFHNLHMELPPGATLEVQATIIPFSLPRLAIYKFQKQSGYARLHVDLTSQFSLQNAQSGGSAWPQGVWGSRGRSLIRRGGQTTENDAGDPFQSFV